jgi:hypothetical protein
LPGKTRHPPARSEKKKHWTTSDGKKNRNLLWSQWGLPSTLDKFGMIYTCLIIKKWKINIYNKIFSKLFHVDDYMNYLVGGWALPL